MELNESFRLFWAPESMSQKAPLEIICAFLIALYGPSNLLFISQRGVGMKTLQHGEEMCHSCCLAELPAICQVGLTKVGNLNSMRNNQMI